MLGPYRSPEAPPPPPPDKMRPVLIAVGAIAAAIALAAIVMGVIDARQSRAATAGWAATQTATSASAPPPVEAPDVPLRAGIGTARALVCVWGLPNGETKCWGRNDVGLFGADALYRSTATTVPALRGAHDVWGEQQICAIFGEEARCWNQDTRTFDPVPGAAGVAQLSFDNQTGCAVTTSHHVVCWGNNIAGTLGDGTTISRPSAAPVPGLGDVDEVRASQAVVFARKHDGTVVWWGRNWGMPRADRGTERDVLTPTPFPALGAVASLGGIGEFAIGLSCVLRAEGTVACWGSNLRVTTVPGIEHAKAVARSTMTSCAILADGQVECWRDDLVASGIAGVRGAKRLVGVGFDGMCALASNRDAYCWGSRAATRGAGDRFVADYDRPDRADPSRALRVFGLGEPAPACEPDCSGRGCGDDGCGNPACGACPARHYCRNGACQEIHPRY